MQELEIYPKRVKKKKNNFLKKKNFYKNLILLILNLNIIYSK
jgi:hypothetical protein